MTDVYAGASVWYLPQRQPWAPVTSHAVNILLRLTANDRPLPMVWSVEEALQRRDGAAAQGGAPVGQVV